MTDSIILIYSDFCLCSTTLSYSILPHPTMSSFLSTLQCCIFSTGCEIVAASTTYFFSFVTKKSSLKSFQK